DIAGGLASIAALALFCRVWQPSDIARSERSTSDPMSPAMLRRAWMPWVFLSVAVTLWGLAPVKALLNGGPTGLAAYRAGQRAPISPILSPVWNVPLLHRAVFREFPVETSAVDRTRMNDPTYRGTRAEAAQFTLNWASATGTAIL